jgi:hypothetical protein
MPFIEVDNRGQRTCNIWWSVDGKKIRLSGVACSVADLVSNERLKA